MAFLSGLFSLVIWINAKSFGVSAFPSSEITESNPIAQVLIFYALIGGTVAGSFWPTVAPVTAEVVGLAQLPAALSITWVNLVLPTTFSEPIALEIAERTGSYVGAQLFAGFMYLAAASCLWMLKAWKHGELENLVATRDPANPRTKPKSSFIKRLFMWGKV